MKQNRILVVEDDPEMADVLRQGFEQDNLSVCVAYDGGEGFEYAKERGFQAIVLDLMLPVLDGFEVANRLRAAGDLTPILMLTARDGVSDIVHGLDSGVDDYLTKPFSFLELSARVRALIRRGSPNPGRMSAGDLVLDAATHQVTRRSRKIHLTPTEFLLLETLMRHKGRVVLRRDLIEHVWAGTAVEDNTLDVAMSTLRARIDRPGSTRLIHTVRGFGYRLEESI